MANLREFKGLEDLYKRYSKLVSLLVFEGRKYEFKDAKIEAGCKLHLYHCSEERHYISIRIKKDKPVLISVFYSSEEVNI